MIWLAGIPPAGVFHAIIGSAAVLLVFGIPAAIQQQKFSPILQRTHSHTHVDWGRVAIVAAILVVAVTVNVVVNSMFPEAAERFPFLGAAVWMVIALSVPLRRPDWEVLPRSFRGAVFLLALVLSASLMPVERLPLASWQSTLSLGFLSAIFDNIPLTALALKQGGYDWGFLAYAVGFGGSILWFGSSAGVALCNSLPEARSVQLWLRHGWPVIIAYLIGFSAILAFWGWAPG
jgi:Na+/H+ antiporter NhaD/arsenite permease-like protein